MAVHGEIATSGPGGLPDGSGTLTFALCYGLQSPSRRIA
jgi:hypothetical protein